MYIAQTIQDIQTMREKEILEKIREIEEKIEANKLAIEMCDFDHF